MVLGCVYNSPIDATNAEHWWAEARRAGVEPNLHMASYPVPAHPGMLLDILLRVQPGYENGVEALDVDDLLMHQWHV